jgi:hypothetical protein
MRCGSWLVAIAAAVAVTACNGTMPGAARPPFPVIGSATGMLWHEIGPGLAGPLITSSSNVCQSGRSGCMDAVVGEMDQRVRALGCSHLAPFAAMYGRVSSEVRRSVQARRYRDPAYVAHLDSVFATFYFNALDRWRRGGRVAVPQAWRLAFAAAQARRVSTLGDMLLGMNAHISRDLPFVLASVGLRESGGVGATADVNAINIDIERAQGPTLAAARARFDPDLAPPQGLPRWLTPSAVPRLIAQWRLEALANARALIEARSAAGRSEVETHIDDVATLRSLLIWRATAYPDPTHGGAPRDRYCAARAATRR